MRDLKGRVAIVTGAGQGQGRAVAQRLAQDGATVVVVDINPDRVPMVVKEITDAGGAASGCVLDLGSLEQVKDMAKTVIERHGQIDILCNVAGIGPSFQKLSRTANLERKMFWEVDPGDWEFHIRNNLYSCMHTCYAVLPHMIERKYGRIINWESSSSFDGQEGFSLYATAKGGVFSFTKCLAGEAGKHNITVNGLSPSATPKDRVQIPGAAGTDTSTRYTNATENPSPMKRPGKVEEIAAVASFLASEDASWITGQTILATGGRWMR